MNRNVSGIEPAPSPTNSHSIVHTTTFWKTIGSVHQLPRLPRPPRPAVVAEMTSAPPTAKITSLTMYSRYTAVGHADAVDRPVLRQRFDPLEQGSALPFLDVDRRCGGSDESHGVLSVPQAAPA